MAVSIHNAHAFSGGWREAIAGWAASGYGWLFADMPGIAALGAVAALVLTLIKIAQAVMAWRSSDRSMPMRDRLGVAFGTRPAPLDD
jgi:hypothetical protein